MDVSSPNSSDKLRQTTHLLYMHVTYIFCFCIWFQASRWLLHLPRSHQLCHQLFSDDQHNHNLFSNSSSHSSQQLTYHSLKWFSSITNFIACQPNHNHDQEPRNIWTDNKVAVLCIHVWSYVLLADEQCLPSSLLSFRAHMLPNAPARLRRNLRSHRHIILSTCLLFFYMSPIYT